MGLLEHRLQFRQQVRDRFLAPPPLHVEFGRPPLDDARTVEGDRHRHVLDRSGPHVHDDPAATLLLQLEHPQGVAPRKQLIGGGIVEGDRVQVGACPTQPLDVVEGLLQDGEVLQA